MRVVVDTNIIFSSLLRGSSALRDTLISKEFSLFSPNYVFAELFNHKNKILKCTHLDESTVLEYLTLILENIQFVKNELVTLENRRIAFELCRDIDEKDTPFVALALELDAQFWTGDKKLIDGLRRKGWDRFL